MDTVNSSIRAMIEKLEFISLCTDYIPDPETVPDYYEASNEIIQKLDKNIDYLSNLTDAFLTEENRNDILVAAQKTDRVAKELFPTYWNMVSSSESS